MNPQRSAIETPQEISDYRFMPKEGKNDRFRTAFSFLPWTAACPVLIHPDFFPISLARILQWFRPNLPTTEVLIGEHLSGRQSSAALKLRRKEPLETRSCFPGHEDKVDDLLDGLASLSRSSLDSLRKFARLILLFRA
jgi:hypothetical protein